MARDPGGGTAMAWAVNTRPSGRVVLAALVTPAFGGGRAGPFWGRLRLGAPGADGGRPRSVALWAGGWDAPVGMPGLGVVRAGA